MRSPQGTYTHTYIELCADRPDNQPLKYHKHTDLRKIAREEKKRFNTQLNAVAVDTKMEA